MSRPAPSDPATPPGLMRRLGAAGPFAILLSVWPPLGSLFLIASLTQLGPWLRSHDAVGLLIYFLVIGFLLGVSFVPTYASAILAGWAFGFGKGAMIAILTITASSLLAYAVGRWIARDRVLEIIRERPKWHAIYQAFQYLKSYRIEGIPTSIPFHAWILADSHFQGPGIDIGYVERNHFV